MSVKQIWAPVPWGTNAVNQNSTNTENKDKSILGKDDFLKILITQMRYQDPLEPMDTKESIAQMASFSSLEQMQNLNKSFGEMSKTITEELMPSVMLQQASTMIGREVAYVNPDLDEDTPEDQVVLVGQVSSISMYEGRPVYIIGKHKVPFGDVIEMGKMPNSNDDALAKILEKLDNLLAAIKPEAGEADGE